ncbi:MAG: LolA family protein [Alphaproteobacteria bacterium]
MLILSGFIFCSLATLNTPLLKRIEEELNNVSSLETRFVHEDSTGKHYAGTLYLKRSWKMRMAYDTPSPFLIVSDGQSLIYEDQTTHEAVYLPLETSPLSFILDTHTDFQKVLHIDKIVRNGDEILIYAKDKKNYFSLILQYSLKEKSILGWISKDAQGNEVTIKLQNIRKNIVLEDKLFVFQQKPRWLNKARDKK